MINKTLQKQIQLDLCENIEGNSSPMKLEYYLLESENAYKDEIPGEKFYGIEIVKKINGMNEEFERVKNLSCCMDETKKILDKLADNTVTPITLLYVLDDMIGI